MIHVILNPASGAVVARSAIESEIGAMFEVAGASARLHRVSAADIPRTVGEICDEDENVAAIVAAGGDGTVGAVASGLAGSPTLFGVLPLGTLNHFAKDLKIPMDLPKAVDAIVHGERTAVDVGQVNDCVFVNNCSIGVYPDIVERREMLRREGCGKWRALALASMEALRREHQLSVRVETGGRTIISETPFVFVGNNEYQAEGVHLGARTALDGGQLFAYLAPQIHTRDLPKLFLRALAGRVQRERSLVAVSSTEIWIESTDGRDLTVACDGELLTLKTPLHFRSWRRALCVKVPAGLQ